MTFTAAEDTFFKVKKSLNCRGRLLDLSTPAIMGILNLTPDSFFDGGKISDEKTVLSAVESMLKEGADIIDIGGQSTRPKAKKISSDEEWMRISSPLKSIRKKFPDAIISVDTFYADVAERSLSEGAAMINDISGGDFDDKMFDVVTKMQVPYVIMHIQGTPENMQDDPQYENVAEDVMKHLIEKVVRLKLLGLHDIIIDPGFGFGKTVEHNYSLLKNLRLFGVLNCPIMAGVSRKSMVTKVLNVKPIDALNGTTVLNTIAMLNGASILRVHDVRAATEAKKIVHEYLSTK